ncbi:hypothetical protein AC1031_000270 [Aphanomyces cochlioides]|nr:hypothetical protein AC1031_000270 [Aphanomyces cochlioides]
MSPAKRVARHSTFELPERMRINSQCYGTIENKSLLRLRVHSLLESGNQAHKQTNGVMSEQDRLPMTLPDSADPEIGHPKPPLPAYFYFCREQRSVIRANHPTYTLVEIDPLLAEQWRCLPDDTRAIYNKMASDTKAEYEALSKVNNAGSADHGNEKEEITRI